MSPVCIPIQSPSARVRVAVFILALAHAAPVAAQDSRLPCVGDCSLDGSVTVDEVVVGVSIALGQSSIDRCPLFDRSNDGAVTVDEVLAAVAAALSGCTPNQPPVTEELAAYRTYPGQDVRLVLPASDPDGNAIAFEADELPPGASLDADTGLLSWQPTEDDVGSYAVEYVVTDDGLPPLFAVGHLRIEVLQANACLDLDCDPATGCMSMPLDLAFECCPAPPDVRNPDPLLDCPEGAGIAVGRNIDEGFGPLQDCDLLPLRSQGQGGTRVTMHIAARCIRTGAPASLRVQLYTVDNVLVNLTQPSANFGPADNGYVVQRNRAFSVDDSTVPPQEFEGKEAQLAVTIQDADGLFLEKTIRVLLTLGPVDDLPDINSPVSPTPVP